MFEKMFTCLINKKSLTQAIAIPKSHLHFRMSHVFEILIKMNTSICCNPACNLDVGRKTKTNVT